jgi:hypothetical protein
LSVAEAPASRSDQGDSVSLVADFDDEAPARPISFEAMSGRPFPGWGRKRGFPASSENQFTFLPRIRANPETQHGAFI